MNLKYYYWYFQSAIPERICDDIIRYGKEQDKQMALTGHADKDKLTELEDLIIKKDWNLLKKKLEESRQIRKKFCE